MLRAIAFFALVVGLSAARTSYAGEQVVKCNFANASAATYQQLIDSVDVWGALADHTIDIRVKNSKERTFVESLLDGCITLVKDLEEEVRLDEARNLAARANASADWFTAYHTYDELDEWYQTLAAEHENFLTYGPIGTTYNGNQIKVLKFSVVGESRPNIYMQAQIHAREWIAGATANYIINQLVTDYINGLEDVVNLLHRVNIHFVPILNIDGYKWTWTNERLWRKNRNPNPTNPNCPGTDVNRNYNDHWGQGGSSTNPCSDTYMGPSVASELETQATQNYFKSVQSQSEILVGIDWHSYSQLVLRPYGWTYADSPDEAVLKTQGDDYAATIFRTSGQRYVSQKSIDLYVTTGTASDWFYGQDASEYNDGFRAAGYTVELRPVNNPPGFLLPPDQIIPTGNENYRALIPFLHYFISNPLYYPQ